MHYIVYSFLLIVCNSEKSLKVDIYPGFGWDHLRFIDMSPIFDVSNFNDSDLFQSCIEMIPLHENKIETGSTVIDTFDSRTTDYSSNLLIAGSAGFGGFKIGGSYSNEYQKLKEEQGAEQTITLRNHIDYLMVDVILQPTCPLNLQVKKELIDIAKYITTKQSLMATYAAQLFVKKYGTHYTSRLQLGGSISEDDFVSHSTYYSGAFDKRLHKAAAEASFLGTFSLSASYSSSSKTTDSSVNQYKQNINRKVINSRGGDVFTSGNYMQAWQSSVQTKPAIIRRGIENITYFIQSDKIPELTEEALMHVRKEILDAIDTYIEINAIRGCMHRDSPSFNWIANVDDGSCAAAEQNSQFGGFIRTCTEDSRMAPKCNEYRLTNFYTGNEQCPPDFSKYLLHRSWQYESLYRRDCYGCGFLWLSTCCNDIYIGTGERELTLYGCNKNNQPSLSSYATANVNSMYVYGGSFTSKKTNPVTEQSTCPAGFSYVRAFDDITICLTERLATPMKTLPRYGGIYSCSYGNIANNTVTRGCPAGYSIHVIGAIDGNCLLSICLKFEKFEDIRNFPAVVLPPFFELRFMNSSSEINKTMESGIITSRMMSKSEAPQTIPLSSSKSNDTVLAVSIVALVLSVLCIAIIGFFQMKKYRKRHGKMYNDSNNMNMACVKA